MKKRGLGKGLDAIFAENVSSADSPVKIKIQEIEPNREQPRKEFESSALAELADSIAQHGVLQPILLRPMLSGGYRIVAGERRWRASRMAGLTEIPAVVREMTDTNEMLFALIENLQREDLSPLEEAKGYRTLIETQSFTQEEVSKTIGKSRPAITNSLRLLQLPEKIQQMVEDGKISAGHARTLLSFEDEKDMLEAAEKAASGLSVRELEKLAQQNKKLDEKPEKQASLQRKFYEETQLALNSYLGRKVKVSGTNKKGTLQIEFYGEEDLKNLIKELKLKD